MYKGNATSTLLKTISPSLKLIGGRVFMIERCGWVSLFIVLHVPIHTLHESLRVTNHKFNWHVWSRLFIVCCFCVYIYSDSNKLWYLCIYSSYHFECICLKWKDCWFFPQKIVKECAWGFCLFVTSFYRLNC